MSLRLGFCGVGRWARKLAESFRACGAEVVAYDRSTPRAAACAACGGTGGNHPSAEDNWHTNPGKQFGPCPACKGGAVDGVPFGKRMPWRDQLADKSIDAIVAVAPPEITTEVALACAAAGKPVMATKPLFDHPERVTAPFYVDFWRLWSEAHQRARRGVFYAREGFTLAGCGPMRSFPGALDYGPHVMAALLDLPWLRVDWESIAVTQGSSLQPAHNGGDRIGISISIEGDSGAPIKARFGNGCAVGIRNIWGHDETPTHIGSEPKEAIMQKFCRAFMSDVSEGFVSTDLLNYSRDGMALLERIRREAK